MRRRRGLQANQQAEMPDGQRASKLRESKSQDSRVQSLTGPKQEARKPQRRCRKREEKTGPLPDVYVQKWWRRRWWRTKRRRLICDSALCSGGSCIRFRLSARAWQFSSALTRPNRLKGTVVAWNESHGPSNNHIHLMEQLINASDGRLCPMHVHCITAIHHLTHSPFEREHGHLC